MSPHPSLAASFDRQVRLRLRLLTLSFGGSHTAATRSVFRARTYPHAHLVARHDARPSTDAIAQAISDRVQPIPEVELRVFPVAAQTSERYLVVARIYHVRRGPCMADERVYIRAGSSARPARPDEIRRLVIGSLAGEVDNAHTNQ